MDGSGEGTVEYGERSCEEPLRRASDKDKKTVVGISLKNSY